MTAKSDRLDAYVRRANQLDDDKAAALADATAGRTLLQEITRQPVGDRTTSRHRPARRRIQLATATATATATAGVVLVVLASTGVLSSHGRPPVASSPTRTGEETQTPERYGDPFGARTANSCVNPALLPPPTFAFDGTVAGIGTQPPADPVTGPAIHLPVTFTVNRWFRGGSGDRVTVAMAPPGQSSLSEHPPGYTIGSRLLVSGTDNLQSKIALSCGFTLWYNRADARAWERAGGYVPSVATPIASGASATG